MMRQKRDGSKRRKQRGRKPHLVTNRNKAILCQKLS